MKLKELGFGEGFHTFWRKGSEGTFSVLLWNMIYTLPPEIWHSFSTHILTQLGEEESLTAKDLKDACVLWAETEAYHFRAEKYHYAMAFSAALQLTPDEEWDRLGRWFRDSGVKVGV